MMTHQSTANLLTIQYRPIADLAPYTRNARAHSDAQIDAIARSIHTFGFTVPVLIDAQDGIIAGHGRVLAARRLDMTKVPTIQLAHLTDAQRRAYILADNKLTERGGWDRDLLGREVADLREAGIDLELTGFEAGELDELLQTFDADDGPEPQVQPQTKQAVTQRGDLWILGEHRLLCGDSASDDDVARLMDGRRAQCIITDPPYGVSYIGKTADAMTIASDDQIDDDLVALLGPAMQLAARHSRDDAALYIWHATSTRRDFEFALDAAGLVERQYLTWVKHHFVMGRADYQWQTEPCFYLGKAGQRPAWFGDRTQATVWRVAMTDAEGNRCVDLANGVRITDGHGSELYITAGAPKTKRKKTRLMRLRENEHVNLVSVGTGTDAWQIDRPSASRDHPTAKPTELATIALHNSTRAGDLVLDLFGGSGFVLLGAEQTGRKARVMELDPVYCDVILRRWAQATGNDPVRASDGAGFSELEPADV